MSGEVAEKTESLTFASERFVQSVYEDAAMKARLREIRLVNSTYHAKTSSFAASNRDDEPELKPSFSGEPIHTTYLDDRGIVAGSYLWNAEVKLGRAKLLKASAEYLVLYSGLKGVPEEYAFLYFKKLSRFATYPYFRAHFATNVAASGITLAPLPSLTERMD